MNATHIYNMVSGADTSGIEEFSTLFAYEGFNPEMIHAHFAKIKETKGISDMEFIGDMRAMITLGAMKGNYTLKNAGKISEAGRAKADSLFKKYEMKQGALAGDKKAIILPRVLSAFPELTTKVILKLPPRDFGVRTGFLPKIFKNPVFPSLVPKTLSGPVAQCLLWIYTMYSADQSIVISQEKDTTVAFSVQKQFVTIAFNSTVPTESTRISMIVPLIEDMILGLTGAYSISFSDAEVSAGMKVELPDVSTVRNAIRALRT
jgi:hypothetical protein